MTHKRLLWTALALCCALSPVAGAEEVNGTSANLVDVTQATVYDGWGREAVRTLTSYYSGSAEGPVQILDYRSSFLPVFDWANGQIATEIGGDLYDFYASGGGKGRVQYPDDPLYAFSYVTRYQEPAGRLPEQDQGIWECYTYDGAARLSQTSRYQGESGDWLEAQSYAYAYDDNDNVESITTSSEAGGLLKLLPGLLDAAPMPVIAE